MDKAVKLHCMIDVLETLIADEDFEEALFMARENIKRKQKEHILAKIIAREIDTQLHNTINLKLK